MVCAEMRLRLAVVVLGRGALFTRLYVVAGGAASSSVRYSARSRILPSNARHAEVRSPPELAGAHHDIRVQMANRTKSTFSWNHMF